LLSGADNFSLAAAYFPVFGHCRNYVKEQAGAG
jgi:hypothetical protein